MDVIDEVIDVWGPQRVGVKLSPVGEILGMADLNPFPMVEYLISEFNKRGVAYIEMLEAFNIFTDA